jgi:hypothetical protein
MLQTINIGVVAGPLLVETQRRFADRLDLLLRRADRKLSWIFKTMTPG